MTMIFAPLQTEAVPTSLTGATWSPYDNNGGTCVAIAGADYCVIAADTRMSTGFSILTRDHSKIQQISQSSGMQLIMPVLDNQLKSAGPRLATKGIINAPLGERSCGVWI